MKKQLTIRSSKRYTPTKILLINILSWGPYYLPKTRSADMARFFSQAAAYQLPPLIPASVIQGFRRGVLMGFCGYGLFMAVDKILDVINVANPLNGMKSAAGLGNAFTMLVGSLTAILTGGGIATTIAVDCCASHGQRVNRRPGRRIGAYRGNWLTAGF